MLIEPFLEATSYCKAYAIGSWLDNTIKVAVQNVAVDPAPQLEPVLCVCRVATESHGTIPGKVVWIGLFPGSQKPAHKTVASHTNTTHIPYRSHDRRWHG